MKIFVRLKKVVHDSYPIVVERGSFSKVASLLAKEKLGFQYVIITDDTVKKLFGNTLLQQLRAAGLKASLISFAGSESSKNGKTVIDICEKMAEAGAKRDSCVVALGGGITGDVAGFVASIFMRGVPYVHIPTTLLAMIDSSTGGKTGVDLAHGKNLMGSFLQPKMVIVDPNLLENLPKRELRNGFAEMVKHGVIASKKLLTTIAKNLDRLDDVALQEKLIVQNIKIKAKVVQADEKESLKYKKKSRMVLNYGHTIGHAIEKLENYQIPHGEAISIGMVLENRIAVNKKMLSEKDALVIKTLLSKLGLPTKLPANISLKALERTIKADKKMVGKKLFFALPRKIGRVEIVSM